MTFCLMKDLQYKFEDNMSRNDDTARLTVVLDTHPDFSGSSTRKTKKQGRTPAFERISEDDA